MESFDPKEPCPKCGYRELKAWDDLTEDEKIIAGRLPASAEFTLAERKKHRFCTRCWSEELVPPTRA